MARTRHIFDAKTGQTTIVPYTPEEEAAADAAALATQLATPLEPYQFHAMVEIIEAGGRPLNITAIINGIGDHASRAVARAKYERARSYHRNDPLTIGLSAQAGLTAEEMNAYWLQALTL